MPFITTIHYVCQVEGLDWTDLVAEDRDKRGDFANIVVKR
jgi:hypothetical protein